MLKSIANILFGWIKKPKYRYSSVLTYLQGLFTPTQRELMVKNAFSFAGINKIEGDYLEFGVWNGKSLIHAYYMSKLHKSLKNMKFYAFDSFEGLPESKETDLKMGSMKIHNWHKGKYSSKGMNTFQKTIKKAGVPLERVECVPGFYDDSLNPETKSKLPLKKAAIIYIDCDLYESTVPCLDFITDYIQEGTVILFDDWYNYKGNPDKGEQKAFNEWLAKNPNIKAVEFQKVGGKYDSFALYKTDKSD